MLDVRKALKILQGRRLTPRQIRDEFEKVLAMYLQEIPPEFGVWDLFELARRERCLTETNDGRVLIKVP